MNDYRDWDYQELQSKTAAGGGIMTTLREAAQQALEALLDDPNKLVQISEHQWESKRDLAVIALRSALEQQITHADGCWSWGPAHYDCACRELAKAKGWKK